MGGPKRSRTTGTIVTSPRAPERQRPAAPAGRGAAPPAVEPRVRLPRDLGPPAPSRLRPRVVAAVREHVASGRYRPPTEAVVERLVALVRPDGGDGALSVEP